VDGAFRELPQDLRTALRTARLPDGQSLLTRPDVVRLIHALATPGDQQSQHRPVSQDRHAMLRAELAELHALRDRDISSYWQKWRNTGISGSDRALQIIRELGNEAPAKPSATDLRTEEQEILHLKARDFDTFRFGNWKGTGRPASDRLVAIQTGRG
jgi:hypothetical protein